MKIPKIISSWSCSINGTSYLGRAESLQLPQLKSVEAEISGCGYYAKQKVSIGLEPLTAKFVFHDISESVFQTYGVGDAIGVIAKASCGVPGSKDCEPLVAVFHGRFSEIDIGELKANEVSGKVTATMNVVRYTLTKNNIPLVVADLENNIFNLHGLGDTLQNTKNLIGA